MKQDGGPAWQGQSIKDTQGMTLRDWFASAALQGILACDANDVMQTGDQVKTAEDRVALSYRYADAMLAEREK